LLWIVPLAIYLLTFILAFARRRLLPRPWLARALPLLLAPLVMTLNMKPSQPLGALMLLHLATFFIAATFCHTILATDRPAAPRLTEFYLWISIGGALGGLFNVLVAPVLFHSAIEYPLMLVLVCLADARVVVRPWRPFLREFLWPALLALGTAGALLAVQATRFRSDLLVGGLLYAVPTLLCFLFSRRPLRFALGLAGLLLIGGLYDNQKGRLLYAQRTFFGVHRVMTDADGRFHVLYHGRILHGIQSLDPARRDEPLTYYARSGPVGDVLAAYGRSPAARIGVVGLGAGTLASYARPGQQWSFFEIDPTVLKLARDDRFFTFLRDAAVPVRVVLGDARLSLAGEPDAGYDLLILDAYNSDAIPVHLVTREALALYLRKLASGGRLAFHISNTHVDLEPVLAALARDAGLVVLVRADTDVPEDEFALGKAPSVWLVMARRAGDLAVLAADPHWLPGSRSERAAIWTDDYSSLLSILRWR
jgi:SAM-dependent methyltransferase